MTLKLIPVLREAKSSIIVSEGSEDIIFTALDYIKI
jgi:hypothetical protein